MLGESVFCVSYEGMKRPETSEPQERRDSLHVEVGGWFRAHATGLGVLAIPVILLLLALIVLGGEFA